MTRTLGALVLAAGQSARLGQPKQLVRLAGETLLQRSIRVASQAGAEPVFVVLGASYEAVLESLDGDPHEPRILINKAWATGMASSLRLGAAAAERAGVDDLLVLTCDQPTVSPEHLRHLVNVSKREHVVASYYRSRRGIPVLFPDFSFHALQNLHGDAGARELLQDDAVLTVPLPGGEFDLDTPEDLALLLSGEVETL